MYSIPERILFAFRALKSNRLCSCISILGLGLGLACFIVIVKYVWLEYTTDTTGFIVRFLRLLRSIFPA